MADVTIYAGVTPKVWIGCLASYNAGRLIGEWCEATDVDTMYECRDEVAKQAVAAAKKAGEYPVYFGEPEEFFLADHEGFPSGMVGEYSSWEYVAELGAALEEHGAAFEAFLTIADTNDEDVDDLVSDFEERQRGEYDSLKDYAYDYVRECGIGGIAAGPSYEIRTGWGTETVDVLDELSSYLDWDAIATTLDHEGYYEVSVETRDGNGLAGFTTYIFAP